MTVSVTLSTLLLLEQDLDWHGVHAPCSQDVLQLVLNFLPFFPTAGTMGVSHHALLKYWIN